MAHTAENGRELLNDIQGFILHTCEQHGLTLDDHFKTPEEFKQFVISFTLKSLIDHFNYGMEAAWDLVMGEGAYKDFAGRVYHTLRAKAAE